jgi:ubiquinone/menaquinone biosynthesis C-methylase UbiE
MGLAQKLMGHQHGHADDHSGGLIMKPRLYERTAGAWFFGLRKRRYDQLVALAGIRAGDRVLDIGCGTGFLSRRAAMATGPTGTVVGVDPSAPVIEFARGASPSWCRYVVAPGDAVDEPDASFDVAISSLAIHHIPPAQRVATLREMRRLLRPGGRLLVADFRPPRSGVARHLVGALSGHAMQHNPIHLLPGLVAEAGFTVTGTGDLRPFLSYVVGVQPDSQNR